MTEETQSMSRKERVLSDMLGVLEESSRFGPHMQVICAIFVYLVGLENREGNSMLFWFASVLVVASIRHFVFCKSLRAMRYLEHPRRCASVLRAVVFISTVPWIFYIFALFPESSPEELALGVTVVGGLAAGSITTLGALKWASETYIICLLVPLSIAFGSSVHPAGVFVSTVVVCFAMFLCYGARQIHGSYSKAFSLGEREKELSANVREQADKILRANEQLQRALVEVSNANSSKARFLSNLSHEIRNPMNGIIGMAMVALDSEESEKKQECLQMVYDSAIQLLDLMNELLDVSKIEAGRLELSLTDFSLKEEVKRITKVHAFQAEQKGIQLQLDLDESIPDRLQGDAVRFRQIVGNLLSNAIKFTPKKGKVNVCCRVKESNESSTCIRFTVRDTGIGIAPEKLEQIFEPFAQADSSISSEFGGTGLGLAISRELSHLMGGGIEVESKEGEGSTFAFEATLENSANQTTELEKRESIARNFPTLNVLVVEDIAINQIAIRQLLTGYGFKVSIASNGEEAIEMLAKERFDLILMDIHMPKIDGFETTKLIRDIQERREEKRSAIIGVSAFSEDNYPERAETAGMDGFVRKPLLENNLLSAIEMVVGNPKLQ